MRDVPQVTEESTKLQLKFRGPLVITKIYPSDTYEVADLRCKKTGRRYASTAFSSQLKLWRPSDFDVTEGLCEVENENLSVHSEQGDDENQAENVNIDTESLSSDSEKSENQRPKRVRKTPERYGINEN